MIDLEYRHVDVFSRRAFAGNGLVVVLGGADLDAAVLLRITQEMRQFETAFVVAFDVERRTARMRIFTEDEELDFAGHPVPGAASVLYSMLANPGAEEAWDLELAGRHLKVSTRTGANWTDAVMDQGPPRFGAPVAPDVAETYLRALGLCAGEARHDLPLRVVNTGLPYLIVPVTKQGLAQAGVTGENFEELLALSGAKFVYVLDPERPEGRTWDNAGRVEDVATGSAAGPALAYLVHHGLRQMDTPARLEQGRFVGRPSTIEVRQSSHDGHVWVGGPVTDVASGRFTS